MLPRVANVETLHVCSTLSHAWVICCNKDLLLLLPHTLQMALCKPTTVPPEPPHAELLYSPRSACSPHNLRLVRLSRYLVLTRPSSCSTASPRPRFPLLFSRAGGRLCSQMPNPGRTTGCCKCPTTACFSYGYANGHAISTQL